MSSKSLPHRSATEEHAHASQTPHTTTPSVMRHSRVQHTLPDSHARGAEVARERCVNGAREAARATRGMARRPVRSLCAGLPRPLCVCRVGPPRAATCWSPRACDSPRPAGVRPESACASSLACVPRDVNQSKIVNTRTRPALTHYSLEVASDALSSCPRPVPAFSLNLHRPTLSVTYNLVATLEG